MRYGIVSDVHANLPALQAILRLFEQRGVERYICAGDVVGYGPHPLQCIAELEKLDPVWVLGNHELLLLGRLAPEQAPPLARTTLEWTRSILPEKVRESLGRLPLTRALEEGIVVTHGSLRDPDQRIYQRNAVIEEIAWLRREFPRARMLVLGHTHYPMLATSLKNEAWISLRGKFPLASRGIYLMNPGSVGQSRRFSGRARAAILDTGANTVEFVSASYATAGLKRDLQELGFPAWSFHRSPLRRFEQRLRRKARYLLGLSGGSQPEAAPGPLHAPRDTRPPVGL